MPKMKKQKSAERSYSLALMIEPLGQRAEFLTGVTRAKLQAADAGTKIVRAMLDALEEIEATIAWVETVCTCSPKLRKIFIHSSDCPALDARPKRRVRKEKKG